MTHHFSSPPSATLSTYLRNNTLITATFPATHARAGDVDVQRQHEDQLVAAAKYGDSEAFDKLIDIYGPRLHAVARRFVGDDLAYDVVQDAFIAAHRSLRKFRGAASFSTWMHKIVINRCHRVGRKHPEHYELVEDMLTDDKRPEDAFDQTYWQEVLEHALNQLPEKFRTALTLREFSELSYAEIGDVLNVRPGTVKSRIARARQMLKEVLEQQGLDL